MILIVLLSLAFKNEGEVTTQGYGVFSSYFFARDNKRLPVDCVQKKLHGIEISYPNGLAIFIKKELWDKVGGYDDNLVFGGDDNDLGIKLWIFGYKNYLFSETLQIHTGMFERTNTPKYVNKLKYLIFAHLYTIVKDFGVLNAIITLIGYSVIALLRATKQSFVRKSFGPILSYFVGWFWFVLSLPRAINKRVFVQRYRIRGDIFLKIKPPVICA